MIECGAFVFWYGAIAQLGERVLCKHEVVGSIPSGSTRWLLKIDELASFKSSAKTSFRMSFVLTRTVACVISDIVKRRSIRVGSCK